MSELHARVEALRALSAQAFDGPGMGLIETLLARAQQLGGNAGARLAARAAERTARVEAAFAAARSEASRELAALGDAASSSTADDVRAAVDRGDLRSARRVIRRARVETARSAEPIAVPWAAPLGLVGSARGEQTLARELDALCTNGVVDRLAHSQALALRGTLSSALYRGSAESVRATVAIARAADNLPEGAGPYNGQVLALRALVAMAELSPEYARVVVAAVDDLAALEAWLAVEAAKAPTRVSVRPPKRKKNGLS
jgi:hypothetical protein